MAGDLNNAAQRPFKNIEAEAAKVLKKHGLLPVHAHWEMANPLSVNIMIVNDPDFEKPTGDDEFDAIVKAQEEMERKEREEARAEKARKELEGLRDSLGSPEGGIGLDD